MIKNKESSYPQYWDVNNLYGYSEFKFKVSIKSWISFKKSS